MNLAKKLGCGAVAALVLVASAAPSEARHRRHRDRDVDAGDVIGAAVVLGGLAAIFSAAKDDGYGGRYRAERKAVKACVREAERGYSATRVRDVTDVERRDGYTFVRGVLETRGGGGGWQDRVERDEGFTCTTRGSRIYDFQRSDGYHW